MPDSKQEVAHLGAQAVGHARLEKFDGIDDVHRFLDHFEVVARANGWTLAVQGLHGYQQLSLVQRSIFIVASQLKSETLFQN